MTPFISFIMPARNGAGYIGQAVRSLEDQSFRDWELIIVDDGSSDGTYDLAVGLQSGDGRIRVEKNPGRGQVQAMNHGFSLASGRFVKTVDCDDLLAPEFSDKLNDLTAAEATIHQALLLDDRSGKIRLFRIPAAFVGMSLRQALRRIRISPPRWAWTISRDLALKVFPLPPDLPLIHEDVFFGLKIKQYALSLAYVPAPLYFYRQHAGQIYGGQFDYSSPNVIRKARAMLEIIDHFETGGTGQGIDNLPELLAPSRTYYELLSRPGFSLRELLLSRLVTSEKARVLVIRCFPGLASLVSRLASTRRFRKSGERQK